MILAAESHVRSNCALQTDRNEVQRNELPLVSLVCWLEFKFCTVTYVLCGLYRLKEEGLSDSSAKTLSRSNKLETV